MILIDISEAQNQMAVLIKIYNSVLLHCVINLFSKLKITKYFNPKLNIFEK